MRRHFEILQNCYDTRHLLGAQSVSCVSYVPFCTNLCAIPLAVRSALGVSAIDTPAAHTKLGIEEIAKIAGNCAKDWPPSFSTRVCSEAKEMMHQRQAN